MDALGIAVLEEGRKLREGAELETVGLVLHLPSLELGEASQGAYGAEREDRAATRRPGDETGHRRVIRGPLPIVRERDEQADVLGNRREEGVPVGEEQRLAEGGKDLRQFGLKGCERMEGRFQAGSQERYPSPYHGSALPS